VGSSSLFVEAVIEDSATAQRSALKKVGARQIEKLERSIAVLKVAASVTTEGRGSFTVVRRSVKGS
jgi:hypothetical protein